MNLWNPWRKSDPVEETKAAGSLQPVDQQGSWWTRIYESFTGAWQRNVTVDRDNVLAYWAVYACIRLIAGDISKLRVKLVELTDGIWKEITESSPYLALLKKPNRYQTRVQFFQHWYCSLLIHGNTYALKERDGRGMVRALYILDPRLVTVLVGEDGSVFYQLKRDNLNGRGELLDVTVPASEIIHDRLLTLHHPLVGVSPIYACGVPATQGIAIQNNSANFFSNGSMPGGIITVPGSLDPAKALELKALWEANYSGANRGKTAVLADKMEYKPLTMSAHDAQLIEQLKMTAEMVCATFLVPAYKVGVTQPPANSNVAAQDQNYYSQCLQVLIEGTEAVLDEGLGLTAISGRTIGVEFDKKALIGMDPLAQMEFVEKGKKASIISPNEGRAEFDLPPVKGGESPLAQQQDYSLAALAKRDAKPDPFGGAEPATPAPAPPVAEPKKQRTPARAASKWLEKALAAARADLETAQ